MSESRVAYISEQELKSKFPHVQLPDFGELVGTEQEGSVFTIRRVNTAASELGSEAQFEVSTMYFNLGCGVADHVEPCVVC